MINTARGGIDRSELGATLMHEHIFLLSPELNQNYPESWGDEQERVRDAIAQLQQLKSRGIDSLVDLTVLGAGRYIPRIRQIASQVNLNILVAAGLYTFDSLPMHLLSRSHAGPFDVCMAMVEMFTRDIREGIGGTSVKAAVLKCATDRPGLTWGVESVLRAVARTQRETGVPILTHTHAPARQGIDQQRIFAEEGVDLSRVVIGHCGDTSDCDYLERLIEKGSYIGMDRFGIDSILSSEKRIATVVQMCRRGFAERMVLSHDAVCYSDWFDPRQMRSALPNWHFNHIPDHVLPILKKRGVTEDQIRTMLVDNPRTLLSPGN